MTFEIKPPQPPTHYIVGPMTLRDYFAGQAMAGLITQEGWKTSELVTAAYQTADAMLAEREKTNDK